MPPTPAARKGQNARKRDSAKTRQDIVYAAGRRFAEAGYSRVTLQEIAADVGITPALIVRYFGSKQGLFEEVSSEYAGYTPDLPVPDEEHSLAELLAQFLIDYWRDEDARWTVMAIVRSLDVEGVPDLFRHEIRRRVLTPWQSSITGDEAEVRQRLLVSMMLGFGLFGMGALVDVDLSPRLANDSEATARYLSEMIEVCLDR